MQLKEAAQTPHSGVSLTSNVLLVLPGQVVVWDHILLQKQDDFLAVFCFTLRRANCFGIFLALSIPLSINE